MKKMMTIMLALALTASVSAQEKSEKCGVKAAINNIMTRTSIRQYTNEPVSKENIETMLRAGMAAPTAVNRQPWHFVVVTDKSKLKELSGGRGGMLEKCHKHHLLTPLLTPQIASDICPALLLLQTMSTSGWASLFYTQKKYGAPCGTPYLSFFYGSLGYRRCRSLNLS